MSKTNLRTKASKTKWNEIEYDHYIGIDWSQVNIALARSTRKNRQPKVIEWDKSDVKLVKEYLSKLKGSIILTIEETTTSQWLYVEIKDFVDRIIICDPYYNRLLSDGPKNDKIDAEKLCTLLRGGFLKEVYHTTDDMYNNRQLLSAYNALKKAGVRIQNQRSALYRAQGFQYKRRSLDNLKKQLDDSGFVKYIIDWQDDVIAEYQCDKEEFEKKIREVVKKNKIMKNLSKISGIGEISAFEILSIVVQPRRFKNKGHYLSYCGLVLLEKTSGNKKYGKRKSRYNRELNGVYKRAARVAIKGGKNAIHEYYKTLIEKGYNHKQATLSAARYIAKVTYGMMKSGEKYEPYRWRKNEISA